MACWEKIFEYERGNRERKRIRQIRQKEFLQKKCCLIVPKGTHVTDHILKISYSVEDAADAGLNKINNLPTNTNSKINNSANCKLLQNVELTQKKLEEYVDSAIKPEGELENEPNRQTITDKNTSDKKKNGNFFLWITVIVFLAVVIVLGGFIVIAKKGK